MNHLPFSKATATTASVLFSGLFLVLSASGQTNYYFDPGASGGTGSGGSGEFNTPVWYDAATSTTDASFASGNNAFFDGSAGTVTVNAPVSANYLEVGVTTGTETIGSGLDASQITLGPVVANQSRNMFQVDSGSENVVFNSNLNVLLENQTYGQLAAPSASSGNVTLNGGITFTNDVTLATDPTGNSTGSPALVLNATAPGGTFTLNSEVTIVNDPGAEPTQNGNAPILSFTGSSASNTLTLTSNASFVDTRVEARDGTILDYGASFSPDPAENTQVIEASGTGQFLTAVAGMTVTAGVQFVNDGSGATLQGTVGSDLAATTTYSGLVVGYSSEAMDLTSAAGGRVNFTGDVVNGNGEAVIKVGAGTINLDDATPYSESQGIPSAGGNLPGDWEIKNGTMLLNGTVANHTAITGGGLEIDNVATGSLIPNVQTYATLGGNGSTSVAVTADGANSSITPGDPTVNNGIGTLTLAGGLTANSGLTMNFTLNGTGPNSEIALAGSNLILGGTITFNFTNIGGALSLDTPYTLITGIGNAGDFGTALNDSANTFDFNAPAGYTVSAYSTGSDANPNDSSFYVEFEAAPEPSTWALMGLGVVLVVGAARFRKLA